MFLTVINNFSTFLQDNPTSLISLPEKQCYKDNKWFLYYLLSELRVLYLRKNKSPIKYTIKMETVRTRREIMRSSYHIYLRDYKIGAE